MRRIYLITLILLADLLPVCAQTARLFSPENGLVSSQVNQIRQDRSGLMWICSEGGLIQFDGMGFELFRHDRSVPYSIPGDSVHDLCEDIYGTKWVGTASGLTVFDSDHNTFRTFDLKDSRMPASDQYISQLLEVPGRVNGSRLYVCTGGYGIYVIDTESQQLIDEAREELYNSLSVEYIRAILLDTSRHLWLAQEGDTGIVVLDADSLEPASDIGWTPDLDGIIHKVRVTAFCEDPLTGNVLIGTAAHGILIYDAGARKIRRVRDRLGQRLVVATCLYNPLDEDGSIRTFLIGDENAGLYAMDTATESIFPAMLPSVRQDIEDKKCTILATDQQGNLWMGLYQTGVMLVPRSMFGFSYTPFSVKGKPGENSACILSVYDDTESDRLWVATDGAGLFCREGRAPVKNYNRDNSGLTNNAVMALTLDRRGTLWIGTYLDGLFYMEKGGAIKPFPEQSKIGTERIRTLAYDRDRDLLYVGTYGAGMATVDPARKTVDKVVVNEDNKWVSSLFIDPLKRLWIGTYNGPEVYDVDSGSLSQYNILPDGTRFRVYAISGEEDGTMWFGTSDGLFRVSANGRETQQFTERDGLANNLVRDILCLPSGEVWISTANGLSRYSPEDASFTNYHASDGLQGNEFRSGAAFKTAAGRLYFGGPNGLTMFNPLLMDRTVHPVPQVRLSKLNVLDSEVRYDPELGRENLIDKHISEATLIDIPYGVDIFSLEFSVPEYTNPQRIVYTYSLLDFDSDWKTAPSDRRSATYTNVPPGKYRFVVRAYFEGAPEQFSECGIDIRIHRPWYLKTWAWLLYVCLAAAGAMAIYRAVRRRQIRKEEKKEAELKELRLGLFTNLTHEIRTPLSLVMDPLRTFRENEPDPDRKDTYNLMYRNCLRINRLVNQLMDIRKIDAGQMPMHFRQTDIVYFIKDIMQSFLTLARSKRVNFSIQSDNPEETLWIDQGNFDKVVYNILSNAFKHTPDGGRVQIKVSRPTPNNGILASGIEDFVEISIFNSGSRIEEEYISRIFDRFVQIDPYDANSGSGVGLNLTKMLVDLHHGRISVENEDDGVVFHVLVPVGKEHLTEEELSATTHHKDLYNKGKEILIDSHEDETYAWDSGNEAVRGSASKKKKIVIVEDDEEMREYLKAVLSTVYNVTACRDGEEAWPVITTTLPDAVVTDLVMPGISGSELCRRIRQNPSTNHIPVLIVTGQSDEDEEQKAADSGADRFLPKPVSVQLILSSLSQAIQARETVKGKYNPAMDYDYAGIQMKSADEQLLRHVVEAIQANLDNVDFDVAALCREVGISRVHLNRKLKETGNVPPSHLIKSYRMKQAAFLLIYNKVNVSEVAYRVGYSSHSYFSSSFREYFGMTPREFVAKYMDRQDDESLKKIFE